MNKTRKGNYYRTRTKKWMEKQGFSVELAEHKSRSFYRDKETGELKTFYSTHDIWGADLFAMDGDQFIAIQVKSNKGDISKGIKELVRHPYPEFIDLWVAYWPERAREPEIHEVKIEHTGKET